VEGLNISQNIAETKKLIENNSLFYKIQVKLIWIRVLCCLMLDDSRLIKDFQPTNKCVMGTKGHIPTLGVVKYYNKKVL
jgi:hypothetical protein